MAAIAPAASSQLININRHRAWSCHRTTAGGDARETRHDQGRLESVLACRHCSRSELRCRAILGAGCGAGRICRRGTAVMGGADRLPAAGDRIDRSMGRSNRARGDAGSVGAKPAAFQFISHATLRLSNPRNAQPPILTGSDGSSRNPFNRANRLGSATSATMAREAKAPAQ